MWAPGARIVPRPRGAGRSPRRLSRADRWLLGLVLPLYLAALGLHALEVARTGLAQLPVFARAVPGEHPRVGGFRLETDSSDSGLELGDRLLRIGGRDLRGVGYVGFKAIGLAQTQPGRPTELVIERDGRTLSLAIEARPHVHPWSRLPLLVLIPLVCVLVLLRAPGSGSAQRFYLGFMSYAFAQAQFYGGPVWQTLLAEAVWSLLSPASVFLMLRWARLFPDEMPASARMPAAWPWAAAALYLVLVRGNYVLGGPLPTEWVPRISMASHGALILLGLANLAWNYAHAFPVGRRRLRWILLGTTLGSVPFVAALLVPLVAPDWAGFERAYAVGFLPNVIWMIGIVFAVTRENAFDVDRLIGATAAWGLAAGGTLAALALLLPAVTDSLARLAGVEPTAVSMALAALLGALAVPVGRRLRPRVDQLLFPDRVAARERAARLLDELAGLPSPDALLAHAASASAALLGAEGFALLVREGDVLLRRHAEGLEVPQRIELAPGWPLAVEPDNAPPGLRERGVALVVPFRREGRPDVFLLLGPKRSGDVYTATDAALLMAIASRVEAERLRFAKQQADRESRAKTDLLAAASHDLRQPLHALGLLSELLTTKLDDPQQRGIAERIAASTQDLDEMLTTLLDRARLDAGALRPEPGAVDLGALFAVLEAEFAAPAAHKGLRLRVVPTACAVWSDRLLLLRVLRNLVGNAIRYTERGAVLVAARRRDGCVRIEVRDSGPGIPCESQRQVFEAFRQLSGGSAAGLGLGLSIVDGICRVLGHAIELRSEPGRGSTFAVTAPSSSAPAPRREPERIWSPAAFGARRVLLVDDDARARAATGDLLRSWGCEVREAGDGAQALARVAADWRPDFVLLDGQLRGETGPDVLAALARALGATPPAAFVTAFADDGLASLRGVGIPVLRKPVQAARLRAVLSAAPAAGDAQEA